MNRARGLETPRKYFSFASVSGGISDVTLIAVGEHFQIFMTSRLYLLDLFSSGAMGSLKVRRGSALILRWASLVLRSENAVFRPSRFHDHSGVKANEHAIQPFDLTHSASGEYVADEGSGTQT